MKRAQLATQLNLKTAQLDALLNQIHSERGGFDILSDDIPDPLADALIAQKTAVQPQIEAEQTPQEKPKRGRKKTGEITVKKSPEQALEKSEEVLEEKAENLQKSFSASVATDELLLKRLLMQRFDNGRVMGKLEALAEERGKEQEYLATKTAIASAKLDASQVFLADMVSKYLDPDPESDFFGGVSATVQESYHKAQTEIKSSNELLMKLKRHTKAEEWIKLPEEDSEE
ncbi:MAG: hypothetical protein ACM37W_00270 [Actinomycetota bacterium]